MKSHALKALSTLILSSVISSVALAESGTNIYKTLDGSVAYCGIENTIQTIQGNKNILIERVKQVQEDDQTKTSLKISVVKCDGTNWILDKHPTIEKYRAFNGDSVEVQYKDFQLMILDKNLEVVQFETIEQIEQQGQAIITANIETEGAQQIDREIVVRAKKTLKSSGGYMDSSRESFGSFNLRIIK